MSRSLRRGVLAATVLTLSIATLSACGAGNDAQTLQVKPDNAATSVGDIKIQNASVVTQPDPNAQGPAVVTATVFNNGSKDQTLESIKVNGTNKEAKLAPAKGSGPIVVPAGGSVVIGGKGNASAVLNSGREAVKNGDAQPVTFDFSDAGKVSLRAFVVPAKSYFKDFGPSEMPSPSGSARPSGSASPSGSPSGAATPSGSSSGSATPGGNGTPQSPEGR
ncbi:MULTISPECIES: copper chaperone PCu(A)C [Streptomyces]|uniref:Copper chaperone PCu(A)C n=2 Tax=Streptomyces rimosus subsp. rimosus TaxID=132474 RepID=L8EUU3_STRR1|nr:MULTISPECIES: lipoprotein [Streptomyces]KOG75270.1 lipoprotein [Kitasatospora aureofaciens]MYT45870.1 DUF461 domain-containing protein [Streptomyces sp. SID5471]KEF05380.1 hypothetical protein DF17_19515 [Streptomyces rimosus]KEF18838.1 hypothetical protein DF18_20755 [Streptomyces rimosus]KUJ28745.1 hypothetical protein ADK46_31455 [Streptomyces rimosus subsp. rimosus]